MITVGNKRDGATGIYVGRPSPLGNPFHIGRDGTRDQVVSKYQQWLHAQLSDLLSPAAQEFARICKSARQSDVTLVCWCAPLLCHADIIKEEAEAVLREWNICHERELCGE